MEDAIGRVLASAPQNAVASARADALSAARRAADTKPLASIDVVAENLGVGGRDLNDQIQVEATYSQRLERGGKRAARVAVVESDLVLAHTEAVVTRLDLIALVQRHYVDVQAAEAQIGIAREKVAIAEQMNREVTRRVSSARDPLFAGTRARTQLAEAQVDLELAIHARDKARERLATLWAGSSEGLEISAAQFLDFSRSEKGGGLSAPDLAVHEARVARAEKATALQRTQTVQDPTVSAGPRYLAGTGDVALVAGVSLPLGNVAEAEAQRRRAAAELSVARFQATRALALAAENVEESRHEAEAIRDKVIPGARQTLAEVRAGYNRGGFTFNDVSAAQSALATVRSRLVAAARRYHEAGVDYDRLTGRYASLAQEARP
jgi:cobalt-zinc-cadmium efflux system outer membrane protein